MLSSWPTWPSQPKPAAAAAAELVVCGSAYISLHESEKMVDAANFPFSRVLRGALTAVAAYAAAVGGKRCLEDPWKSMLQPPPSTTGIQPGSLHLAIQTACSGRMSI